MSYARGLFKNNCEVSVICMMPTENHGKIFNEQPSGIIEGVNYYYSCGQTVRSKYFLKRRLINLAGIYRVCSNILREESVDKTDAIIYYSTSTSRALLLYMVTRIKRILFLKEESELPVGYYRDMSLLQRVFFDRVHHYLFDGLLLITKRLVKFYLEEKKLGKPYLIVPLTVDFDRFSNVDQKQDSVKYIAYCGLLNNSKDGVDILIDSFAMLSKEFPDIALYLIGESASAAEARLYADMIEKYQLANRVMITGRISKNFVPELLFNASILVLARPESLQAEGGFPTKLGEYLATGNPVVVTNVGEIPDYLTDEVNVFLAEPGSIVSFYSKMKEVLLNYEYAKEIGEHGKEAAYKYFNFETNTRNIIAFIKSLR